MTDLPAKPLFTGEAVGGPLAGQVLSTDYPKGILIIDRPKKLSWIYDWDSEKNNFVVRDPQPGTLEWDQDKEFNVRRAMEQNNYEVRSHPYAGEEY